MTELQRLLKLARHWRLALAMPLNDQDQMIGDDRG